MSEALSARRPPSRNGSGARIDSGALARHPACRACRRATGQPPCEQPGSRRRGCACAVQGGLAACRAIEPATPEDLANRDHFRGCGRDTPAVTAAAAARAPTAAGATPALDLTGLEQRLRETHAIGLFTKLSLKNQVDDLLANSRIFTAAGRGYRSPSCDRNSSCCW